MFTVATQTKGDERTLVVSGTIDLESSPRFWVEIESGFAGVRGLWIDLSDVGYIDSSGIGTLIRGLRHAKKANISLVLRNPSPKVQAVLAMSNLDKAFSIERTG